ncbi:MAG TPA: hypothetical protein VNZ86_15380 [Bacteroidia bacterium]|jgi:hypothetical protein|nr:hypothetical protein [Bacteroidia bacterium]
MKNTVVEKTETIKQVSGDSALKSKEGVKEIMHLNTRLLKEALESNTLLMKDLKEQWLKSNETYTFDALTSTVDKNTKTSLEAVENVLHNYNKQISLFINQNLHLLDTLSEYSAVISKAEGMEKILKLMQANFEAGMEAMNTSASNILELYSKHTRLSDKLNHKLGELFILQAENFRSIQTRSIHVLTGWASDWWSEKH